MGVQILMGLYPVFYCTKKKKKKKARILDRWGDNIIHDQIFTIQQTYHHGLNPKRRSDRRTSVRPSESNTSLICSHGSVVSSNTIMSTVSAGHKADTMLLCLINCHLHAMGPNIKS